MRASGRSPSSAALLSLITTTAAAPSLSGQACRPSRCRRGEHRLELGQALQRRAGRGPSSRSTTVPSGSVTGVISSAKKPFSTLATARSCDRLANSSISSRETCSNSARSRPSDPWRCRCREAVGRCPRRAAAERPLGRASRGGEDLVGSGVAGPGEVAADGLEPAATNTSPSRPGWRGRPCDGLQARRAVAVDRHARHVVQPAARRRPADVEAGLPAGCPHPMIRSSICSGGRSAPCRGAR